MTMLLYFSVVTLLSFAVPCAPGSFFNNSGPTPRCDLCPFHYYQDESEQTECKTCPNGTFTIARGSINPIECKGTKQLYSYIYGTCLKFIPITHID